MHPQKKNPAEQEEALALALTEFVDAGGNVLAVGRGLPPSLAEAVGFEVDSADTAVIDYHHHVDGDVTLVTTPHVVRAATMVGAPDARPVLFRGLAYVP